MTSLQTREPQGSLVPQPSPRHRHFGASTARGAHGVAKRTARCTCDALVQLHSPLHRLKLRPPQGWSRCIPSPAGQQEPRPRAGQRPTPQASSEGRGGGPPGALVYDRAHNSLRTQFPLRLRSGTGARLFTPPPRCFSRPPPRPTPHLTQRPRLSNGARATRWPRVTKFAALGLSPGRPASQGAAARAGNTTRPAIAQLYYLPPRRGGAQEPRGFFPRRRRPRGRHGRESSFSASRRTRGRLEGGDKACGRRQEAESGQGELKSYHRVGGAAAHPCMILLVARTAPLARPAALAAETARCQTARPLPPDRRRATSWCAAAGRRPPPADAPIIRRRARAALEAARGRCAT
jgi:hypothetical protein